VDIERTLRPLLDLYAPPVKGSHQPALPYWHLQTDGVWELPHAAAMERTAKGSPTIDTEVLRCHVARPNPTRGVTQVLELGGRCLMPSDACAKTQGPAMSRSLALMYSAIEIGSPFNSPFLLASNSTSASGCRVMAKLRNRPSPSIRRNIL
jgi:hypothetical protein